MPNRCENLVCIKCERSKQIDLIIDAIRGDGLFATFIPWTEEIRKDWILECVYWNNGSDWRKKHGLPYKWLDYHKDWFVERPYKQLWYDWQSKNWWAKRDYKEDEKWMPTYISDDWTFIEFNYDSPRTPHYEWRKQIADRLWCYVDVKYREPLWWFSWQFVFNWSLVEDTVEYDDEYFGRWKKCSECWTLYDVESDDDRYDTQHTLCAYCAEQLSSDELSKRWL